MPVTHVSPGHAAGTVFAHPLLVLAHGGQARCLVALVRAVRLAAVAFCHATEGGNMWRQEEEVVEEVEAEEVRRG